MSSENPKNTVATVAAKINSFASQFSIKKDQVNVTSYRQEGDKVRVFFTINKILGLTPEQAEKVKQPIVRTHIVMMDPFDPNNPVDPVDPGEDDVLVTSITPSPLSEINVGETADVTVSVLPNNATNNTFSAVSSNPSIIEVQNGGTRLLGKAAGNATITYTSKDGSNVTSVLQVRVVVPVVYPTAITPTINKTSDVIVGDRLEVTSVAFTPANTTDKSYVVKSSDATIGSVNGNVISILKAGSFNIVVESGTGSNKVTKSTAITVTNPNSAASYPAKFSFKEQYLTNGDYVAKNANVDDIVNFIIKPNGLTTDQTVELRLQVSGCTATLDNAFVTVKPGVDTVVPVMVTGCNAANASLNIGIFIANTQVGGTQPVSVQQTAQTPGVTFDSIPTDFPIGSNFNASLSVNSKYTPRNVVWSATPNVAVKIEPNNSTNDTSAQITIQSGATPNTQYVFTAVVDGVTVTSNQMTVRTP